MKWVKLNINHIPHVMKEIDRVSAIFIRKLNEIRNCKANVEEKEEFLKLRECIINRVEELDTFYEDNFGEDKVFYFEKARIKLKQLLAYDVHVLLNNEELPFVDFEGNELITNQKADELARPSNYPNKKSIHQDMTTKRISVLISNNPFEEKLIQFGQSKSKDFQETIPHKELQEIEETISNIETPKENICIEEIYTQLKTNIVFDEGFYIYLRSYNVLHLTEKENMVFKIKLTQSEIESIKQAKECISK